MIKTQFETRLKIIRIENGTKFFNTQCNELFKSLGIVNQNIFLYTPQQNGVIEMKHRHILNIDRVIRFQSHMPITYQGLSIQAIVYLINRLPSSSIDGKTPYDVLFSTPPFLTHLRVIGYLYYGLTLPKGYKVMKKAQPTSLMVYSTTLKRYLYLNLTSNKLFVSRYVIFHKDIFLFTKRKGQYPRGAIYTMQKDQ